LLASPVWLLVIPIGIIVLLILCIHIREFDCQPDLAEARTTAEQFADALEKHLLGKDDSMQWEDLSFTRIADERLAQIQRDRWRFDSLSTEQEKKELEALIAAIRSGSPPEVVRPTHLTYPQR
jgi:hypothetical protein